MDWTGLTGPLGRMGKPRSRVNANRPGWRRVAALADLFACTLFAFLLLAPLPAGAQEMGRQKLPVLGKIGANGPTKGAFTGVIQIIDRRSNVLEVGSADGTNSAIFPISKKVKISSIEGRKLKLAALTPGTNVLVTYEQQGGRRTVQEITILTKATASKKPGPTSS
ncbi:MAG: hypothetical protein ACRD2P_08845 [Terriglobia bacterium]